MSHKSKAQVQEMLAARHPRPDVPQRVEVLPAPQTTTADRIEVLSPGRYKVQFTATTELRKKLERATDLMRHQNPRGDVAVIVERALDLLIAKLEKQRLGKTERPTAKTSRKSTRRGYVTRAVRREVFERDGEQCKREQECRASAVRNDTRRADPYGIQGAARAPCAGNRGEALDGAGHAD